MAKKYRFFMHYNKPASLRAGKRLWSVHFRGTCHIVENVESVVPWETKTRKIQPFCVIQGMAGSIYIENNKAFIQ